MVARIEAPAKIKASSRIILSKMLIVNTVHSVVLFIKEIYGWQPLNERSE
jgi:hypothetical protein